jgi:WD40 repeat protein
MTDQRGRRPPPDDTLETGVPAPEGGRPEIHEVGKVGGEGRERRIHRRRFLEEALATGVGLSGLSALLAACGKEEVNTGHESWKNGACMLEVVCSHRSEVTAVAYSPDGGRVASASGDATVKIWSASSGALLLTYTGHAQLVRALAFSPDGTRIVSGGYDGGIRIWNAATGALVAACSHPGLKAVAFGPDGQKVASAGDTTVKVWDAATSALLLTYTGHANLVNDVAFDPGGSRIASCSSDATVQVWEAATGVRDLSCVHANVVSVAFSPDGSRLVSGGTATAQVWSASTGQLLLTVDGYAGRVAFRPGGAQVASAGFSEVRTWDASTGATLRTIQVTRAYGGVFGLAFSPDGARLATGDGQFMVKAWDAATGALATSFHDAAALITGDSDCTALYEGGGDCRCNTVCYCDLVCSCDQVCTCNGQGPCTCHFVYVP